ncbi:MAG: macro domain-containing protein [Ruminococcus sp.]
MPFQIIIGDIAKQNVDAIVIPAAPRSGPSSKYAKAIYQAAGYDELLTARRAFGHLSDGEAGITPGFHLPAKHVIHVYTPEWFGGISGEPKYLTRCYCNALKAARTIHAESIAFPLLGVGTNRVPLDIARKIAVDTIYGYLRAHALAISAYLVIHPTIVREYTEWNADRYNMFGQDLLAENHTEQTVQNAPCECAGNDRQTFRYARFLERIKKHKNPTELARSIDCAPSTINRIINHTGKKSPHKTTVLALAVGLGLSAEERYDFVNCAGHTYPFDDRDYKLEELLEQGYTKIRDINVLLEKAHPGWGLLHKSKGDKIDESM